MLAGPCLPAQHGHLACVVLSFVLRPVGWAIVGCADGFMVAVVAEDCRILRQGGPGGTADQSAATPRYGRGEGWNCSKFRCMLYQRTCWRAGDDVRADSGRICQRNLDGNSARTRCACVQLFVNTAAQDMFSKERDGRNARQYGRASVHQDVCQSWQLAASMMRASIERPWVRAQSHAVTIEKSRQIR
jgi:hypothetical protein